MKRSFNYKHFLFLILSVTAVGVIWFIREQTSVSAAVATWTTATSTAVWEVPAGVTSVVVKMWAAGGGSGGADRGDSGAGGGGGYITARIAVTPGENISVKVGGGGTAGTGSGSTDAGGGGGGYTALFRDTDPLLMAGGGAGGGAGADANAEAGGAGGAGGANSTVVAATDGADGADGAGNLGTGGTGATTTFQGLGGSANSGYNGENGDTDGAYAGGDGGANQTTGTTGGGGAGGLNSGGEGGASLHGGGGGGGGYHGGGGGEAGNGEGGGGGGGGASFATSSAVFIESTAGSGVNPGNASDSDRTTYCSTAGTGGASQTGEGSGNNGNQGCIVIYYNSEAPAFSGNVVETPDAAAVGESVTFSAAATDADGNNWYLAVCKTDVITAGAPPACATDQTLCVSSTATSSGSTSSCVWTVAGELGTLNWYAFACDNFSGAEKCSAANTVNSPFNIIAVGNTQVTLEDIYCKIMGCTASTSYAVERSGSVASTMHTLEDIYGVIPAVTISYGRGWTPNSSGDGSTALTEAACAAASGWEWFEDGNGDGYENDPEDGLCVKTTAVTGTQLSWNGYGYTTDYDSTYIAGYDCEGNFPTGTVKAGTYNGLTSAGAADTTWDSGDCALCEADCFDGKRDLPAQGSYTSNSGGTDGYSGPLTPEVLKNWQGTRLPTRNDFYGFCGYKDGGSDYETGCSSDITHGTFGGMAGRTDECLDLSDSSTYEWLSEQAGYDNAFVEGYNACSYISASYVSSSRRYRAVFRP